MASPSSTLPIMVHPICPIDITPVLPELRALAWQSGGARPRAGEYAMISWPFIPTMAAVIEPVIAQVLTHLPGCHRGMTLLSRLIAGQRIDPHCDHHDRDCTVRVHVPLVTNPLAVFCTGGVEHHMPIGWAYAIDPTQEHSAYNGGTEVRIHLMFNAVKT